MPGIVSGKFRSMLIDIFGRSYPERQFFLVDRDAVARYKARVHGNVAAVARAHRRHSAQRGGGGGLTPGRGLTAIFIFSARPAYIAAGINA